MAIQTHCGNYAKGPVYSDNDSYYDNQRYLTFTVTEETTIFIEVVATIRTGWLSGRRRQATYIAILDGPGQTDPVIAETNVMCKDPNLYLKVPPGEYTIKVWGYYTASDVLFLLDRYEIPPVIPLEDLTVFPKEPETVSLIPHYTEGYYEEYIQVAGYMYTYNRFFRVYRVKLTEEQIGNDDWVIFKVRDPVLAPPGNRRFWQLALLSEFEACFDSSIPYTLYANNSTNVGTKANLAYKCKPGVEYFFRIVVDYYQGDWVIGDEVPTNSVTVSAYIESACKEEGDASCNVLIEEFPYIDTDREIGIQCIRSIYGVYNNIDKAINFGIQQYKFFVPGITGYKSLFTVNGIITFGTSYLGLLIFDADNDLVSSTGLFDEVKDYDNISVYLDTGKWYILEIRVPMPYMDVEYLMSNSQVPVVIDMEMALDTECYKKCSALYDPETETELFESCLAVCGDCNGDEVCMEDSKLKCYSYCQEWYDKKIDPASYNWCIAKCDECIDSCPPDDLDCITECSADNKPSNGYTGMTPNRHDIEIWRGSSFEQELVSQIKVYNYAYNMYIEEDVKRSHAENLEYYGYVYEYIDFVDIYDSAEMHIRKPWVRNGDTVNEPLLTLSTENGRLELTSTSIKIGLTAEETAAIDFDTGTFDLELRIHGDVSTADRLNGLTNTDKVDKLVYGTIQIKGEVTT